MDVVREWIAAQLSAAGGALETVFGRLAHPAALWLLAVQPLLWVLAIRAWFRRRRLLRRLGTGLALRALTAPGRGGRGLRNLCWSTGTLALILGVAGPRWGTDPSQQATSGRDLVVVLDLSRSMLAEQPGRQERARRALLDLADSLQRRGGHRVALVAFAASARVVCPLTHDYDHFREAVKQQDANNLPPELRPARNDDPSGTRIGAGLRAAVAAHDPQAAGFQDILLVSDGDDPAGDEEWAEGVAEARTAGIPVYCLGVGDPAAPSTIPTALGPLQHDGQPVRTRLHELPLQEIARSTGGLYFPARTHALPQGALYREILQARARQDNREVPLAASRPRYPWFFGAALALLAASLLLAGGGPRRPAEAAAGANNSGRGKEGNS
jgi:Ca-activated chloride channel family protein